MINKRKMSAHKLTYIALAIVFVVCGMLGMTYSALTASKTATGTIIFTGDLALCMTHGSSGDNASLSLTLTPDFVNTTSAENINSPYFANLSGKVGSLNWPTHGSNNDIVFSVYTLDNTSIYLNFTIELTYKPASASNLPETAQDWLVFPVFGSSNYAMSYIEGQENGNTEYSYYAISDGMVISYPEYEETATTVTKRFHCYYVEFPEGSSEATMKKFTPQSGHNFTSGNKTYTSLNKSVNFSDVISDIVFFVEGGMSPNNNDEFSLKIKCDTAIYPQV